PTFKKTLDLLVRKYPGIHITIPTVDSVEHLLRAETEEWEIPVSIITDPNMRLNAFAASCVALAASGTVTLELALAKVPSVIAYKVNPLSAVFGYFLVNKNAVVLPNQLMGEKIFPLYLQWECTPANLFKAISLKIDSPTDNLAGLSNKIRDKLRASENSSESIAAQTILNIVKIN
ncbi:MAG: lipid-A-disaccharide synthase, partial [Pseudomonadota bacterium]|nr:lipid-A-disaccharide synthase [Pseudomonadota bacterium]